MSIILYLDDGRKYQVGYKRGQDKRSKDDIYQNMRDIGFYAKNGNEPSYKAI